MALTISDPDRHQPSAARRVNKTETPSKQKQEARQWQSNS